MLALIRRLLGKPPMNPLIFYTGKIAGYVVWIYFMLSLSGLCDVKVYDHEFLSAFSIFLLIISSILILISIFYLGSSTRFGLPIDDTVLKMQGIYRFSRNPMYLGFYLLTLAAMIYTGNIWIIVFGIYSMIVYHLIILHEEKFLELRFGQDYFDFKNRVRRYL